MKKISVFHHSFKLWRLLTIVAGLLIFQNAQATSLMYEPFSTSVYANGTQLSKDTGDGWTLGNSHGTGSPAITNIAALSFGGLLTSNNSYGVQVTGSPSSGRNAGQLFTAQTMGSGNPTLYFSFLVNVQASPTGNRLIGLLASGSSATPVSPVGVWIASGNQVGIAKNNLSTMATSTASALSSGTHLIVLRYKWISSASSDDEVDLWVDPTGLGSAEGSVPTPALSTTSGSDVTAAFDAFYVYDTSSTPSGGSGTFWMDEIRVGTTWADVTPSGTPPVASQLGFTTQPSNTTVNATMSTVVVQVQALGGGAVASNGVPVTLTLTSGSGTLSGTTTQNTDSSGKATFGDLSINTVGTVDQFTASASGIGAGLANAVSGTFSITNSGGGGGGGGGGGNNGLLITGQQMASSGFVVNGNGPTPSEFAQILASPDITQPLTNWILVTYGNLDGSGNIVFTNPTSPAISSDFYVLGTNTSTKIQTPSILTAPVSQTVAVGQTATFSVTATGPFLFYLWYFNGNPLWGQTNLTLTINNAQAGNVGNYSVIVANPAGSAMSTPVTLRVGNYAPTIITQPQGQTLDAGGTAIFNVVADGTLPLNYQWYDNNSAPISSGTNATLALNNVQTTQAGPYFVKVSNNINFTNSSNATLTINAVPTALPDTNMIGFAAVANVTGGAGGTVVIATNYAQLSNYVHTVTGPQIIHVQGTITGPGPDLAQYLEVHKDDKTIIGDGTNAVLNGIDLRIEATNIIVQNLTFQVTPIGTNDAITIDGGSDGIGRNIWIDHCTLSNAQDGSIDVTKGADYVTISWCKYIYAPKTPNFTHELCDLIGSSDSDASAEQGYEHVTIHHCWYGTNCVERMPSVRWGRVHVFNNYYTCSGNDYCVRTRIDAQVLVENNFYQGVQNPWELFTTIGTTGLLYATNNNVNYLDTSYGVTWVNGWVADQSLIPGTDTLTDPTLTSGIYPYTLDAASDVPYYVQTYSGAGKYPYVSP
jgi:pectate lyase